MGGGGVLLGDGGGAGHRPGGALPAGQQEEEEGQAEAEQDQVETRTLSGGYCSTTVSDIRYPGYLQISTQRERTGGARRRVQCSSDLGHKWNNVKCDKLVKCNLQILSPRQNQSKIIFL